MRFIDTCQQFDISACIALRKPVPLRIATAEASQTISGWETNYGLQPSQPQVVIGDGVARWLPAIEARTPKVETPPIGQPAIASLPPTGLTRVSGGLGR